MRQAIARKYHKCKKNGCDIWPSSSYFPQRRGKAICFECGRSKKKETFIVRLLRRIAK